MFKQNSLITRYCLAVVVMLALLGPLAQKGRGDFVLYDNEQLTVNSYHNQGTLYDTSRASIVSGGTVYSLYAYDSSVVDISGGNETWLSAYNSSTTNISGGSVSGCFSAYDSSTVNISGGYISNLYAKGSSLTIFYGQNFHGFLGLVLNGDHVLCEGVLSGEWMDGTLWSVNIQQNDPTATILAVSWLATCYVNAQNGNDNNDGLTPGTAFATIQKGIDSAKDGGSVIVYPGTYYENIDFKGKSIVVRGTDPNDPNVVENTVINGSRSTDPNNGATVTFAGSEDANCVITGFTITGGTGNYLEGWTGFWSHWGGGICIEPNASPTITKNVITGNSINGFGGANIYCGGNNQAVITHNIIENGNTLGEPGYESYGGGIYCEGPQTTTLLIGFNVIKNNHSDRGAGITCGNSANAMVSNNVIYGNIANVAGGGIHLFRNSTNILNNTLVYNSAPMGSAIHCWLTNDPVITNNIIAFNLIGPALSIYRREVGTTLVIYCDFWSNEGSDFGGAANPDNPAWIGNIYLDPLFADATERDFHLQSHVGRWDPRAKSWVQDSATSRCIDAGDPNDPVGDEPNPNGDRINQGADGGTAEASKSPYCAETLLSDLNHDCRVDFIDFAIFVSEWLECRIEPPEFCWQ